MRKEKMAVESPLRTAKKGRMVAVAPGVAALDRPQMLRKLSPERRQIYARIRRLREEIGAVDFDVVLALRNLRNA